jgi:hypothetical protein
MIELQKYSGKLNNFMLKLDAFMVVYPIPLFEFYTIFSFSNSSFFSLFCFDKL